MPCTGVCLNTSNFLRSEHSWYNLQDRKWNFLTKKTTMKSRYTRMSLSWVSDDEFVSHKPSSLTRSHRVLRRWLNRLCTHPWLHTFVFCHSIADVVLLADWANALQWWFIYVFVNLDNIFELTLFCYLDKSETTECSTYNNTNFCWNWHSNEKNFGMCCCLCWLGWKEA